MESRGAPKTGHLVLMTHWALVSDAIVGLGSVGQRCSNVKVVLYAETRKHHVEGTSLVAVAPLADANYVIVFAITLKHQIEARFLFCTTLQLINNNNISLFIFFLSHFPKFA
ncbi:hypothetical protein ONS96_004694 [Cadophora gregata f. sp. sojae]|nr:hypothetical protein ONS96_004694 [Cadophora gregata f. sp. sojae]